MNPLIEHIVFSGVTRHGKSQGCVSLNGPRMLQRDGVAYVVLDPAGSMAAQMAGMCLRNGKFFLYDTLNETAKTLGYDFFTPSANPDWEQREAENREAIMEAIAVAIRSRGLTSVEANPIIKEGLQDAFNLLINQKVAVPFYMLRNCFVPESDDYQYLLHNCTDPQTFLKFTYYGGLVGQQREFKCGPAERIIQGICDSPQFRKRCVPTFDLAAFLNAGGKLFVDGRSVGNLSRPDASLLMGQIILTVIRLARSGKLTRRVVLIIDEGVNASLIDQNLVRAMAEAGKWGLEIQVIVQNPLQRDEAVTDDLFGNANCKFFFKHTNAKAARFVAEMVGYPTLDPLVIRKTDFRTRQVHDGFDLEAVVSKGKWESDGKKGESENTNYQARPKYREETDQVDTLYALEDLIKLKQRDVMNQGVGQCFIMRGNSVSKQPEQLALTPEPWEGMVFSRHPYIPLWQEKLRLHLDQLKATNPAYQVGVSLPVWTPPSTKKRKQGLD
jgi:type IV secretory system conjugative DNA transfer VirD4/TraG family protein